ncbi:hypothetical protein F2P56_012868, partial [Juglans regia]
MLYVEDEAVMANAELESCGRVEVGTPLDAKANEAAALVVLFAFVPESRSNPSTDDEGVRGEGDVNEVPLKQADSKPSEFVRVWDVDRFDGYVLVIHGCKKQVH